MAKRKSSYSSSSSKKKKRQSKVKEEAKAPVTEEIETPQDSERVEEEDASMEGSEEEESKVSFAKPAPKKRSSSNENKKPVKAEDNDEVDIPSRFLGDPVPDDEAKRLWPKRYEGKKKNAVVKITKDDDEDDDDMIQARCHYKQAEVDGRVYNLNDDAYVKGDEIEDYIGRIIEMFESDDGMLSFTAQWFYRAKDTVIQKVDNLIDKKRVFLSEMQNVNPLDCLVSKLTIAKVQLNVWINVDAIRATIPECDYYYDMKYLLPYSTFVKLPQEEKAIGSETSSTISSDVEEPGMSAENCVDVEVMSEKSEVTLLDLYSGCGAMSTGLCLGANLSGVRLVTKWAIDLNQFACQSLQLNHPETQVRNETAEDFLSLIKVWEKLCICFSLIKCTDPEKQYNPFPEEDNEEDEEEEQEDDGSDAEEDGEVFEVENILAICFGDPKENKARGLYLKIRWKNYGEEEDTWEPIEGLSNCREKIKKFVMDGYKSKILPLPGTADVICGGPPCQGVSGFNRFRDSKNPLNDEKNKQLSVYMEVVDYLKPRFVLMENVVDLVRFADGFLGRYAMARLIQMNYQVRMGLMAAGAYGLPQFRMRCFFWGAHPSEKLPQCPLPTHDVINRGNPPLQFDMNLVAFEQEDRENLGKKLLLEDAISDLPPVENNERKDELPYRDEPKTDFQRFIRMCKHEMLGLPSESELTEPVLYDHRPLELNVDDYERSCRIPKKKGANFRDLPGVLVCEDNRVKWDPNVKRELLKSGKPLVPDYAMTFVKGRSVKPFGRLWWDETVPTVVTRAEPHNQVILHPSQDRVLTIRENARLQGFPDYYKLLGPIKERYIQVGNAVAVPVARALGYALGLAFHGTCGDEPLLKLPQGFPNILEQLNHSEEEEVN